MTAAEIRSMTVREDQQPEVCAAIFLREIAAQFADFNDLIRNCGSFPVTLFASNDSIPVVVRER